MNIYEKQTELFCRWEESIKARTPSEVFIRDGVVSEDDYLKSDPKIVFVLKEVNFDQEEYSNPPLDLDEFLRNGGKWKTWNNVTRWVHGIRNLASYKSSFRQRVTLKFRKETLKSICVLNLKKLSGGSRADSEKIAAAAERDKAYIREQYALYDPDITICGGTYDWFRSAVGHDMELQKTQNEDNWYQRDANKYVVGFYHPQATKSAKGGLTAKSMYDTLLGAIDEIMT